MMKNKRERFWKQKKHWKKKRTKRIKPKVNKCSKCKTGKVLHHHYLCDKCWEHKSKLEGDMKW